MDLLHSKETILNEVTKIIDLYQQNNVNTDEKISNLTTDIKEINKVNQKLIKEIDEKDKLLMLNEKKCYDYEVMINKIQEQANKEMDEKTRHDMLRAQDKEIFNRDEEIKRLQKQVNELTTQNTELTKLLDSNDNSNNNSEEEKKAYYENLWKTDSRNSLINDPEKVKIAIEGYENHTNLSDVTEKCVGLSSLGINGWYNDTISLNNKKDKKDKTLVEKMKEVNEKQEQDDEWIHVTSDNFHAIVTEYVKENNLDLNDSGSIKLAMVKDKYSFQLNVKDEGIYFKELSLNNELENPVVSEVVEEVEDVEDSGETTEELSDVEDDKSGETTEDKDIDTKEEEQSSDEEEISVTTIKHYGKEYYIIDNEEPQYIYAIEDGGLGDVKGEMKNGKKNMYKK